MTFIINDISDDTYLMINMISDDTYLMMNMISKDTYLMTISGNIHIKNTYMILAHTQHTSLSPPLSFSFPTYSAAPCYY